VPWDADEHTTSARIDPTVFRLWRVHQHLEKYRHDITTHQVGELRTSSSEASLFGRPQNLRLAPPSEVSGPNLTDMLRKFTTAAPGVPSAHLPGGEEKWNDRLRGDTELCKFGYIPSDGSDLPDIPEAALKAFGKLEKHMRKKLIRIQDLFRESDDNGDGMVTIKEMFFVIKSLKCGLDDSELYMVMDFIDSDRNGMVDIVELETYIRASRRKVRGVVTNQNKTVIHSKSAPRLPSVSKAGKVKGGGAKRKLPRKRAKVDANGEISALSPLARTVLLYIDKTLRDRSIRALDLFNSIDVSTSRGKTDNHVDLDEFSLGMKKIGLQMKEAQVTSIFDELDANGDHDMDILEFDKALRLARRLKAVDAFDFGTLDDFDIKEVKWADLEESFDFASPAKKNKKPKAYNSVFQILLTFIGKALKKDDYSREAMQLKKWVSESGERPQTLRFSDLVDLLKDMGFTMSKRELATVAEEIGCEDEKTVDVEKLRMLLRDRSNPKVTAVEILKGRTSPIQQSPKMKKKERAEAEAAALEQRQLSGSILLYIDKTLRKKNWKLLDLFNRIDEDKGNSVDLGEFTTALDYIGLEVQKEQVGRVFKQFDNNGDGTIDVGELDSAMRETRRLRATGHDFGSLRDCGIGVRKDALRSGGKRGPKPPAPLKKLLSYMNMHGMRTTELFRRLNLKSIRKNEVSKESFTEGLLNFRLGFSPDDLSEIFAVLDKNRDGAINMKECQQVLQGYIKQLQASTKAESSASQKTRSQVTDLTQHTCVPDHVYDNFTKLNAVMRRKGMRVKDLFASMDADGDGSMGLDEFEVPFLSFIFLFLHLPFLHLPSFLHLQATLVENKFFLKKTEMLGLFQFMDGNGNGDVSLEEMELILRNFKRGHYAKESTAAVEKAKKAAVEVKKKAVIEAKKNSLPKKHSPEQPSKDLQRGLLEALKDELTSQEVRADVGQFGAHRGEGEGVPL
jgi:Ca2+-binding EF-hand superfamily protein